MVTDGRASLDVARLSGRPRMKDDKVEAGPKGPRATSSTRSGTEPAHQKEERDRLRVNRRTLAAFTRKKKQAQCPTPAPTQSSDVNPKSVNGESFEARARVAVAGNTYEH